MELRDCASRPTEYEPVRSWRLRSIVLLACLALCGLVFFSTGQWTQKGEGLQQIRNVGRMLLQAELAEGEKKSKKAKEEKKSGKESKAGKGKGEIQICANPNYPNVTLHTITDLHMESSFSDLQGEKKFEGSDVIQVGNYFYVVYDNLWNIGRIDVNLSVVSPRNVIFTHNRSGTSGYEGIVYDDVKKQFFVVIESEKRAGRTLHHSVIERIQMNETDHSYNLVERCESEFAFKDANKGFEGAALVRIKKRTYMLGLCEGNYCDGGNQGKQTGNGRIVVMQYRAGPPCSWRTVRILQLPSVAAFQDYSALAIRKTNTTNQFDLAITSQENSQLWVGRLIVGPRFDLSDWRFTNGSVYNFPRDSECNMIYCSVEGIGFLDEKRLVAVSDQGGGQQRACVAKDESIHTFMLPGFN